MKTEVRIMGDITSEVAMQFIKDTNYVNHKQTT